MLRKRIMVGMMCIAVLGLLGCAKKVKQENGSEVTSAPSGVIGLQVTEPPKTTEVPNEPEKTLDMVTFSSPELVTELCRVLNKQGNEFSKGELQSITELVLQCDGETSLEEVSNLSNLKFVSLTNCAMGELSVLSELSDLEYLYLETVAIDSLEQLPGLKQVQVLSLYNTEVTSLAGIEKLTGLKELYVSGSLIEDAALYTNRLRNLRSYEIEESKSEQVTEYASFVDEALEEEIRNLLFNYTEPITFEELDTITDLVLFDDRICALNDLKQCRNLKSIIMFGLEVSNLMPLMEIESLEEVIIYSEEEMDYSCLLVMENIVRISVNDEWVKGNGGEAG